MVTMQTHSGARRRTLSHWLSDRWFSLVHRTQLIYNTCWEDPRLDREALRLGPDDTVLTITSAGCNALDYALDGPERIIAVDLNPHQNALLELKIAAIRSLDYEDFFALFGRGRLPGLALRYATHLRKRLSTPARDYWDCHLRFFAGTGSRPTFYFHGAAGVFAWLMNRYIDIVADVRDEIEAILQAATLDQQRDIYFQRLKPSFWGPFVRWLIRRDVSLSLLGVPRSQRLQIDRVFPGGVAAFVERSLDAVFAELPLRDNYFWRVYLTGEYAPHCCPEYLTFDNFLRLRDGLVDRIEVHTASVADYLRSNEAPVTRFVLLDHMDWLAEHAPEALRAEWQAIFDRAAPGARIVWRSAGVEREFVDRISIQRGGCVVPVRELLNYEDQLAGRLHALDRVHTYGSFHVAKAVA